MTVCVGTAVVMTAGYGGVMTRSVVQLRVPPSEKAEWEAAALAAGLSLSAWIRGRLAVASGPAVTVVAEPYVPDVVGGRGGRKVRKSMCVHRIPAGSFCSRCD